MARPAGISGLAVAGAAVGGFLVYAAIKDVEIVGGLRDLISGKIPAGRPPVKRANFGQTIISGTAGTGSRAPSGAYKLGLVLPHVSNAAYEVGGKFGIKSIGGWRAFDPFPDHPSGRALDFMINDIPNGMGVGESLANYLAQNAAEWRVDYLIWNRRTWNSRTKTWGPYTATSNPHTDHVHATFFG